MKQLKRENKGFSLVELVVVVLILGILAVAVTPQVMKWVGKSKIITDKANAKEIKYGLQVALTDWQKRGGKIDASADFTLDIKKDGTLGACSDWSDGTATVTLKDVIDETFASEYPKAQYDVLAGTTDVGFRITYTKGTGMITVTCEAQTVTD
ncbi:MAG: prepilin-type N-terminal cleavage/methylation domain-containing protein [Lachnospiraceae bacterium]|nr:prepilin-type N-terminal cleavage/methylation domain-containing protein [Lachnospiraceae bacterium]